jgi:hypothetical protein
MLPAERCLKVGGWSFNIWHRFAAIVGQALSPALSPANPARRLKGGGSQDWLPHSGLPHALDHRG